MRRKNVKAKNILVLSKHVMDKFHCNIFCQFNVRTKQGLTCLVEIIKFIIIVLIVVYKIILNFMLFLKIRTKIISLNKTIKHFDLNYFSIFFYI